MIVIFVSKCASIYDRTLQQSSAILNTIMCMCTHARTRTRMLFGVGSEKKGLNLKVLPCNRCHACAHTRAHKRARAQIVLEKGLQLLPCDRSHDAAFFRRRDEAVSYFCTSHATLHCIATQQ